jgi:hypothetical protein
MGKPITNRQRQGACIFLLCGVFVFDGHIKADRLSNVTVIETGCHLLTAAWQPTPKKIY